MILQLVVFNGLPVNNTKAALEEHCLPSSSQFLASCTQAQEFGYHPQAPPKRIQKEEDEAKKIATATATLWGHNRRPHSFPS